MSRIGRDRASYLKSATSDRFTVLSKPDESMCSTVEIDNRATQERDMTYRKAVYSEWGVKEDDRHR